MSRRRINTYGKATKKILVHDLFNVSSKQSSLYEPVRPPTIDHFIRTRTGTPLSELSEDPEPSRQLNDELRAAFDVSRSSSAAPSSKARSQTPPNAASPAVFELASSEDEMPAAKTPAKVYKRRKIVGKPPGVASGNAGTPTSSSLRPNEYEKGPSVLERNKAAENTTLGTSNDSSPGAPKATVNARQDPRPIRSSKPPPQPVTRPPQSPRSIGSPASEKSTESMVSTRSTPKRKRATADDVLSDISSPSKLELSSLRLTPARSKGTKGKSVDLDQSDSSVATPSMNRRRMVDKLDGPRNQNDIRDVDMKDSHQRGPKVRKTEVKPQAPSIALKRSTSPEGLSQPQMRQDDSTRNESTAPKVRTYGKQRSHLKDMMSGLEDQSRASSQTSLEQLMSQVNSATTTRDDFDIESEGDDPGTRLKSIHELRQAGLSNRFEREIETLLEDIESETRALRIQGLMQLVRKLQEQTFKRTLLESGKVLRLTTISQPDLDLVSASILLLAFWALAVSETATAQALSQIYIGILALPVHIISETRSMFRVARDRTQNLSKALIRDLADFESHVVDQSLGVGRHAAKNIIISRVALRSLEFTLRRLVELAEPVPEPSAHFVEGIVHVTGDHVRAMESETDQVEHVESVRLLTSWLEMSAATSKEAFQAMTSKQLTAISQKLAEVMAWALKEHPTVQQSCIRSAVELSNANTTVCEQFARTELLGELFAVIQEHFSHLNDVSEDDQVQVSDLDSVILALGCLLNLMDYSSHGRQRMLGKSAAGASQVDILVDFFKQHVDETDEVSRPFMVLPVL